MVELALVIPIFLVLIMGVIDFSLALKEWIAITNEAREGARYAALNCATAATDITDDVETRIEDSTKEVVLEPDNVQPVELSGCTLESGDPVSVRVHYNYDLITPLGGLLEFLDGASNLPGTIALSSSSNMRME